MWVCEVVYTCTLLLIYPSPSFHHPLRPTLHPFISPPTPTPSFLPSVLLRPSPHSPLLYFVHSKHSRTVRLITFLFFFSPPPPSSSPSAYPILSIHLTRLSLASPLTSCSDIFHPPYIQFYYLLPITNYLLPVWHPRNLAT